MTAASYQVADEPTGTTEFRISPASAPLPIFNLLASSLFLIFGLIALPNHFIGGVLILLIPGLFYWWVWKKNSRLRSPMHFRVGRNGIIIGDSTIPAAQIHRLILRNHVTEQEVAPEVGMNPTVIVGTPGAVLHASIGYGLANMGASAGRAWHQKRAKVSWRLDAEVSGRATTLGCGMDEVTAYGLLQDATNRLRSTAA